MPAHKYEIGQEVRFRPARLQVGSPWDAYVIVRLLPEEQGSLQYQIKHTTIGLRRVVREGEISPLHEVARPGPHPL